MPEKVLNFAHTLDTTSFLIGTDQSCGKQIFKSLCTSRKLSLTLKRPLIHISTITSTMKDTSFYPARRLRTYPVPRSQNLLTYYEDSPRKSGLMYSYVTEGSKICRRENREPMDILERGVPLRGTFSKFAGLMSCHNLLTSK